MTFFLNLKKMGLAAAAAAQSQSGVAGAALMNNSTTLTDTAVEVVRATSASTASKSHPQQAAGAGCKRQMVFKTAQKLAKNMSKSKGHTNMKQVSNLLEQMSEEIKANGGMGECEKENEEDRKLSKSTNPSLRGSDDKKRKLGLLSGGSTAWRSWRTTQDFRDTNVAQKGTGAWCDDSSECQSGLCLWAYDGYWTNWYYSYWETTGYANYHRCVDSVAQCQAAHYSYHPDCARQRGATCHGCPTVDGEEPIIMAHGFLGQHRDKDSDNTHYWGVDIDLQEDLRKKGYNAMTATFSATGSNWARMAELYCYIKGCVVDYGRTISSPDYHSRCGRAYPGLYPQWDANNPVSMITHSMGGTTAHMLTTFLSKAEGDADVLKKKECDVQCGGLNTHNNNDGVRLIHTDSALNTCKTSLTNPRTDLDGSYQSLTDFNSCLKSSDCLKNCCSCIASVCDGQMNADSTMTVPHPNELFTGNSCKSGSVKAVIAIASPLMGTTLADNLTAHELGGLPILQTIAIAVAALWWGDFEFGLDHLGLTGSLSDFSSEIWDTAHVADSDLSMEGTLQRNQWVTEDPKTRYFTAVTQASARDPSNSDYHPVTNPIHQHTGSVTDSLLQIASNTMDYYFPSQNVPSSIAGDAALANKWPTQVTKTNPIPDPFGNVENDVIDWTQNDSIVNRLAQYCPTRNFRFPWCDDPSSPSRYSHFLPNTLLTAGDAAVSFINNAHAGKWTRYDELPNIDHWDVNGDVLIRSHRTDVGGGASLDGDIGVNWYEGVAARFAAIQPEPVSGSC